MRSMPPPPVWIRGPDSLACLEKGAIFAAVLLGVLLLPACERTPDTGASQRPFVGRSHRSDGPPESAGISAAPGEEAGPPGADPTVKKIFTEQCAQCHSIAGIGTRTFPLDHEGHVRTRAWIEVQIRHPEKHDKNTAMPLFPQDRMTDKQLHDLSSYLVSLH